MAQKVKYGIGEQDFKSLRERNCVYVDKTVFIEKIIDSGSKYYFLARPRRFGKSLFLSTLRYFFEGKRELFEGLYINSINWNWESFPVLRFYLNLEKYAEQGTLDNVLDNIFNEWEINFGVTRQAIGLSSRFHNIIKSAHEKTGHQVVILVDEYDKPLVGDLNNNDNFEHYRQRLASLYSNFKSSAEHIKLVFLTGVSRFSKLSVFSDLNNLNDITFFDEFSDICGISEKELEINFRPGIQKLSDKEGIGYDDALKELKENYDGYRFSKSGSDIYNPWSLLNCLDKSEISNYWNETGLPTILMEALKRVHADLEYAFDSYCSEDELKGMDLLSPNPTALMYQTGYLTIKDYLKETKEYRLGLPNHEVKKGFFNFLLPYYVECQRVPSNRIVSNIVRNFIQGKPDAAMKEMQAFFAGIDYKLKIDNENNFHNAFYLLTSLLGLSTRTEVSTSDGSIDILIETTKYIYVIELKYDHSAEDAINQIDSKLYARPFQTDHRKLFKIGVNFSSKSRCIENWIIR